MTSPYDPLTYENLMSGLVAYFETRQHVAITEMPDVRGPGIYALFYKGDHQLYKPISGTGKPIYVGKAVPPGARIGIEIDTKKPSLLNRLREHIRTIDAVHDLDTADFECRYLVVVPVWITLAERFLIDFYRPIWNLQIDGFGNHDPGSGRRQGEASWWDTLHPGRSWADSLRRVKKPEQARALVEQFFLSQE